jgi:hypothetical protein
VNAHQKPGVFFTFRRPGGIVKRRSYKSLAEALRQIARSAEMRLFLDQAHAQGRDQVVGIFHSTEGRPLLVVVAAAATPLVPEPEPSVPGDWDGSAARNSIG